MKVFFIANWFPNKQHPAEGLFLKNIAEAVALYDHITVFYADEDGTASKVEYQQRTENNVSVHIAYYPSPKTGFKLLNMLLSSIGRIYHLHRMIKAEFAKGRPDLFHFNVISPAVRVVWYYKLFHRIPYVYSEHWDIPLRVKFGLQKNWLPWRIGMKCCALFASKVVVCSTAMKKAFEEYELAKNVEVIPNVVSVNSSATSAISTDKKIILHISSLDTYQKNVYGILEAISEVAAKRSDFELHLLGKGKELQALKDFAASRKLLDSVVWFHGYVSQEEKTDWLRKCAFHLIFSNFEGQSVVTAEALCYGKPVIATRCGGPEDFVNELNGLLIEPRDINELVKAIEALLDNYQTFDGTSIQKQAQQLYSPEAIGTKHHRLYQQL